MNPMDQDENDSSYSPQRQLLSPCVVTPNALLSSSASCSPCESSPLEIRSPSSVTRHADPSEKNNLRSGVETTFMGELSPLSSLICSLDMGESLEDGGFGFSVEMNKAFSDGTLLPYMFSLLSTPERKAIQDQNATTWNGHLPLDPIPPHPEEPHVQWAMPRSRRTPRPASEWALSPHTIFPTTLADPHEVEIFFHSVCLFVLFVARPVAMDCFLYSDLLIFQSCADTGVFFSSHSRTTTLPPLKPATPSPANTAYVVLQLPHTVCLSQ